MKQSKHTHNVFKDDESDSDSSIDMPIKETMAQIDYKEICSSLIDNGEFQKMMGRTIKKSLKEMSKKLKNKFNIRVEELTNELMTYKTLIEESKVSFNNFFKEFEELYGKDQALLSSRIKVLEDQAIKGKENQKPSNKKETKRKLYSKPKPIASSQIKRRLKRDFSNKSNKTVQNKSAKRNMSPSFSMIKQKMEESFVSDSSHIVQFNSPKNKSPSIKLSIEERLVALERQISLIPQRLNNLENEINRKKNRSENKSWNISFVQRSLSNHNKLFKQETTSNIINDHKKTDDIDFLNLELSNINKENDLNQNQQLYQTITVNDVESFGSIDKDKLISDVSQMDSPDFVNPEKQCTSENLSNLSS